MFSHKDSKCSGHNHQVIGEEKNALATKSSKTLEDWYVEFYAKYI